MQTQSLLEVHERLYSDECARVAEAGGERVARATEPQREQLGDEEPGDGTDAQAEGHGEHEHTEQRYPVHGAAQAFALGLLVVGEGAEGGQCHGHEHAAGDEQGQAAHGVDQ